MITSEELVTIGRYTRAHGVQGELSASLDVDVDVLNRFSCLVSAIDGINVPFFVDQCRSRGARAALLTIDGIDDDRKAATLVGKDIAVLKTEYLALSDDADCDAMPVEFFKGYTIVDDDSGTAIGTVADVDDTTANVLFIVDRPDGSTARIPAVDDLVVDIDDDSRTIVMTLPDGLLDL